MNIRQYRSFANTAKKMHRREKDVLYGAIRCILENPSIGEEKKGDLKGIFVYKFRIGTAEYLISYRLVDGDLELLTVGPHENYYRSLKNYLSGRKSAGE